MEKACVYEKIGISVLFYYPILYYILAMSLAVFLLLNKRALIYVTLPRIY